MQYTTKTETPIINKNEWSFEKTVQFTPKRMETSLFYTIKEAVEVSYNEISYSIVQNRCDLCNSIIIDDVPNIKNTIAQIATLYELSTKETEVRKQLEEYYKEYAKNHHFPDIHLNVHRTTNTDKAKKIKGGFAYRLAITIMDSNIVNNVLMNEMISSLLPDHTQFTPTYKDIKQSIKYWFNKRYPNVPVDEELWESLDRFVNSFDGFEKYYKTIANKATNVSAVVNLIYGSENEWILHKCRNDKSTKVEIEVEETENYKYYDFNTKTYKKPVKYVKNEDWIEVYEYGAKRSDRWISVQSKNKEFCLWMPRKAKEFLATYYRKNGSKETKKILHNCLIDEMFEIEQNWNNIKSYLSKEKGVCDDIQYFYSFVGLLLKHKDSFIENIISNQQETHVEATVQMDVNPIPQPTEISVEGKETTKTGKHISISTIYEDYPKTEDGSTDWSKVERNHDFDGLTGDDFWEAMSRL